MTGFLENFHFLRPEWLLATLAALPAAVLLWRKLRSGQAWSGVISESLLPHLLSGSGSRPTHWPLYLLFAAWLLATLALAGPSWQQLPQPVERKEDALVVVLDLSTSMYVQDIAPSRVVRSRQKLLDLLDSKTEGTTGLIAYAGDAHVVSPLTDDLRTVANLLPALDPDIMPVKGSRPGPAIEQAIRLLRDSGLEHGQILLVTDGVEPGDARIIDGLMSNTAYRLSVIGVGTSDGAPIPTADGFLRDEEGNIIIPGLDREPLMTLARRHGGHYSDIRLGDEDVEQILNTNVWTELETESVLDRGVDTWLDMGFWLILLLVPVALGAFRRGWLLCLLLLPMADPAQSQDWQSLFLNKDQRGSRLLERGEAEAAAETFRDSDWAAAANYRAGNYQAALEHYSQADDADSWYNRGNALARAGKLPEAIAAYDEALKRSEGMEDAAFNKALLEQLMQQQNQQQSGDNSQQQDQPQSGQEQQSQDGQSGSEQDSQNQQQASADQQNGEQGQPEPGESQQQEQDGERQQQAGGEQGDQQEQQAQGSPREGENPSEEGRSKDMLADRDAEDIEREMANEQWLRRIPDDPSGLLRRKFLYESRMRANENPANDRQGQDGKTW